MGKSNILAPYTEAIIEAYKAGQTTVALAREYGCRDTAVWYLLKRNGVQPRDRSCSARKFTFNRSFFDVIDTENKAYVLGLLFADGCVHPKTRRVILTLTDRELVEKVAHAMDATNTIEKQVPSSGRPKYTLRISSDYLCQSLISLGCTARKSLTCEFPVLVPKALTPHFIRGYFDGDGSFYLHRRQQRRYLYVSICGTESFLESVAAFCSSFEPVGIHSSTRKHGNIYEMQIKRQASVLQFGTLMYSGATIYLERKKRLFDEFNQTGA